MSNARLLTHWILQGTVVTQCMGHRKMEHIHYWVCILCILVWTLPTTLARRSERNDTVCGGIVLMCAVACMLGPGVFNKWAHRQLFCFDECIYYSIVFHYIVTCRNWNVFSCWIGGWCIKVHVQAVHAVFACSKYFIHKCIPKFCNTHLTLYLT